MESRGEYEFEKIYCNKMFGNIYVTHSDPLFFDTIYPDAMETYRLVKDFKEIHAFLRYQDLYFNKSPTSGIVTVLLAAINGYKEIHLIGIDFYDSGNYAFEFKKKNIIKLMPGFKKNINKDNKKGCHNKELDLKVLEIIQNYFNLTLYDLSLDENHPLNLPKSPIVNSGFIVEDKPINYTKDIMIPELPRAYRATGLLAEVHQKVHQNIFKRLYLDMKKIIKKFIWFIRK